METKQLLQKMCKLRDSNQLQKRKASSQVIVGESKKGKVEFRHLNLIIAIGIISTTLSHLLKYQPAWIIHGEDF